MIPVDFIAEWRGQVEWVQSAQVEQDLVISRALVEIFRDDQLYRDLAFRGGTALYKLHLTSAPRYSEDIDLVQTTAEPIGPTLDRLRARLDTWLGQPGRSIKKGRVTLVYRFSSEGSEPLPLRLKIEINSQEHFSVLGLESRDFAVLGPLLAPGVEWDIDSAARWFFDEVTPLLPGESWKGMKEHRLRRSPSRP